MPSWRRHEYREALKAYAAKHGKGGALVQFTVGLKLKGKTDHIAEDAEVALIAALKVKIERPEAAHTSANKIGAAMRVTRRMRSSKTLTDE